MRNEAWYRERLTSAGVPAHMHDGYILYLLHGLEPGDFLCAVLTNDLREACGRADERNRASLYQHVYFLYNYAPSNCWGSLDAVAAWIQAHRTSREAGVAAAQGNGTT